MSLKSKLKTALITGLAAIALSMPLKRSDAQIYGQVKDVITGLGIPNIEVINEGIDSAFTDAFGNYILDVVSVPYIPPVIQHPRHGQQIRMEGSDIFNIRAQKIGTLKENQTLEDFLLSGNFANGFYVLRTNPRVNQGITSTGKALKLGTDVQFGGSGSLESYNISDPSISPVRSLDDVSYINLFFRDESDTSSTGNYFDIERDSLEVNGSLEHNEEMVPTKIVSIFNPSDTTNVNFDYFMELLSIQGGQTYGMDNNWKTLGYDSIGVYIPPTPPQAHINLHQAALNSIQGTMLQNQYDGYNTLVADLNKANNCPVFFINPDSMSVVNNGGIVYEFADTPYGTSYWTPIRGPPSPLKKITLDIDLTNFQYAQKYSAHELGHCFGGYTHPNQILYPWSIMVPGFTGQNYYIDDQTAAETAILHNYDLPYFGFSNE